MTKPGQSKLPLRLRLLGLRMSNLRDERDGNLNKVRRIDFFSKPI